MFCGGEPRVPASPARPPAGPPQEISHEQACELLGQNGFIDPTCRDAGETPAAEEPTPPVADGPQIEEQATREAQAICYTTLNELASGDVRGFCDGIRYMQDDERPLVFASRSRTADPRALAQARTNLERATEARVEATRAVERAQARLDGLGLLTWPPTRTAAEQEVARARSELQEAEALLQRAQSAVTTLEQEGRYEPSLVPIVEGAVGNQLFASSPGIRQALAEFLPLIRSLRMAQHIVVTDGNSSVLEGLTQGMSLEAARTQIARNLVALIPDGAAGNELRASFVRFQQQQTNSSGQLTPAGAVIQQALEHPAAPRQPSGGGRHRSGGIQYLE